MTILFNILSVFEIVFIGECFAETPAINYSFPSNFKFGVASSAYQIEGAWNEDGKGPSIWDHYLHENFSISVDNSNGDIACDSYHKWREDIALLKELGVNFYRFSISWSRILPDGYRNNLNRKGLEYYKNILLELKTNNIEAMVTIYHWDLPQRLQELGGLTNEFNIDHALAYARLLFEEYGDLVQYWVTFNEPYQICQLSYGTQGYSPIIESPGIGNYLCLHNVLKAHASIWHLYNDEFRAKQNGKISLVMEVPWTVPASNSTEDIMTAETYLQFYVGWAANPVYNQGYPQVIIDLIDYRSQMEGFPKSRLPKFTDEEIQYISGTYDFFGLNHYTTHLVRKINESEVGQPSFEKDSGVESSYPAEWTGSSVNSWLKVYPWALRHALNWVKKTYNPPEILITENGFSNSGDLNDTDRISYHQQEKFQSVQGATLSPASSCRSHAQTVKIKINQSQVSVRTRTRAPVKEQLENILTSMVIDEVNVTAYALWSFLDDFEWASGYVAKFGIFSVNFSDPNRTRTPKQSVEFYKKIINTHCLVEQCQVFEFLPKNGANKITRDSFLFSSIFLIYLLYNNK